MSAHKRTVQEHLDAAYRYTITPRGDSEHLIFVPTTNTDLVAAVRTVPGARWDGQQAAFIVPTHQRTALALRTALTSPAARGLNPDVHPDSAASLAAAADGPAPVDIDLDATGENFTITTPHSVPLRDALSDAGAKWHNTCWLLPVTKSAELRRVIRNHGLHPSPAAQKAIDDTNGPLRYDGSIDGLRGVPVTDLTSVRSARATKAGTLHERLAKMGIESVYDLLTHTPRRYLDRTQLSKLAQAPVGAEVGVLGHVTKAGTYDRGKRLVRHTVHDGSASLQVTFFSSPWQAKRFREGMPVVVWGKLDVWESGRGRVLQMTNPIMDPLDNDTDLIVPIYPQSGTNDVSTWVLRGITSEALDRIGDLHDPLPESIITSNGWLARREAFQAIHTPASLEQAEAARVRLAFDELLRLQIVLGISRAQAAADPAITHAPTGDLTTPFVTNVGFALTDGQRAALQDIRADMCAPAPMHRLLQGDVGSGKTLVALTACLMAVESGTQAALMAPTEVLAWQLYSEAAERLAAITHPDGKPVRVEFLGGKTRAAERRRILGELEAGEIDVLVGTHALLVDDVTFYRLGLVVIDEQHRFGVEQRAVLRDKGRADAAGAVPDLLVMTATPIPRTAALTVFGDLAISAITELPPGRTPIATEWIRGEPVVDSPLAQPWDVIREQVAAGRQAYVVCPLVEESEKLQAASATETYEALTAGALEGLRVGLVHGQMAAADRDPVMAAFKAGDLDVLVATTIIEVGVNVPNATVIAVLDAPRFGLAQLHQLRGRVGRGAHASHCYLIGEPKSADGVERMKAMCASTSGFHLSEVDLRLRGSGALMGDRQSGQSDLRIADPVTDLELLEIARTVATDLMADDPVLARSAQLRNEILTALPTDAAERLTRA